MTAQRTDDTAWMQRTVQIGGGDAAAASPRIAIRLEASFELTGFLPSSDGESLVRLDSAAALGVMRSDEPDESEVLDVIRRRYGRLATQQILATAGLGDLYRGVCELRGQTPRRFGAARVAQMAQQAKDPECSRAVAIFCNLLGDVASSAALTLAARGGVFIGGEVALLLGQALSRSSFRRRFEAGGHASAFLRQVPTFLAEPGAAPRAVAPLFGRPRAIPLPAAARAGRRPHPSHDHGSGTGTA